MALNPLVLKGVQGFIFKWPGVHSEPEILRDLAQWWELEFTDPEVTTVLHSLVVEHTADGIEATLYLEQ